MGRASRHNRPAKRGLSTVVGVLLTVVLIPILIVNLVIIVQSFASPDRVPGFMGYKPLIVLSGSMQPMIDPGDIVVVKDVPVESLEKGDVIAYLRGKAIITHRIVEISDTDTGRDFYTKGDANNVDDGLAVQADMLQGRYLFKIPKAGHAAMFMQTPAGIALFIALPLMAFVAYDVVSRRQIERKDSQAAKELEEQLAEMKRKLAETEAKQDEEQQQQQQEKKQQEQQEQ